MLKNLAPQHLFSEAPGKSKPNILACKYYEFRYYVLELFIASRTMSVKKTS
jgi:hypothetical protein